MNISSLKKRKEKTGKGAVQRRSIVGLTFHAMRAWGLGPGWIERTNERTNEPWTSPLAITLIVFIRVALRWFNNRFSAFNSAINHRRRKHKWEPPNLSSLDNLQFNNPMYVLSSFPFRYSLSATWILFLLCPFSVRRRDNHCIREDRRGRSTGPTNPSPQNCKLTPLLLHLRIICNLNSGILAWKTKASRGFFEFLFYLLKEKMHNDFGKKDLCNTLDIQREKGAIWLFFRIRWHLFWSFVITKFGFSGNTVA